jgi:cytochrome c-type biogenesis protein CcmE
MRPVRLVVAAVLVAGSLGWVAYRGLKGNLVYYRTPTEILQQGRSAVGERIRLGGLVMPGSVREDGTSVRFVVTDQTTRMTVIDTEAVPALFAGGRGVVLEGYYGRDGAFHADTVLVKHNDRYTPPRPGETPHSADVGGG